MIDAIIHGLTQGLANYVQQQRDVNRQREDTEFARQLSLLDQLRSDPRTTPATYGKILHDMLEMSQAGAGPRKPKGGMAGFLGAHELPASQLLTHIASGTIPIEGMGSPSGQAMLQGLVQAPPLADPMMAHSPMGHTGSSVPPPPVPNEVAAAQGQPQAQGGVVGATPPQSPPSAQGAQLSQPPPEPPGTSKMAGAAGPLQAEMSLAPPPPTMPSMTSLMSQFGHQHDPQEDNALRYSSEHMFAKEGAEKFALGAGTEAGKLDMLVSRLRAARTPEEKQLILRQAGIIPTYERRAVMMPDGKVVMGVASRRTAGGYEDESGNDLAGAVPFTPGMIGTTTTSQGDTATFNKTNPSAGVTAVPGTRNVLAGAKVLDNVAGADGRPGKLLLARDGSRQWIANDAIKDQWQVVDDGKGHQILAIKPAQFEPGTGANPTRGASVGGGGVPPAPAKGAAPTPGPATSVGVKGVPPPPAKAPTDRGKLGPGSVVDFRKLNVQDEQSTVAVATALPEMKRAMKLLEDSGLKDANSWGAIIKSKIKNKLYSDWGIKPDDNVADIFQTVGYARAHLLRGLIGARMPVEIAHIIDEHLAKGSQSPALMYHQLRLLVQDELPMKLRTIYETSRVEPPENIRKLIGSGGGDPQEHDDELLQALIGALGKKPNEK